MAVGASELTTAGSAVSQTSYTTASVTPTANHLILAWITNNVPSPVPPTSVTGNGLTWVKIGDGTIGQENTSVWRAMGASPSSGTIVIDFGAVAQNDCEWSIIDYSGTDTSGTNGSGAIVQWNHNEDGVGGLSLTVTLTSAITSGNAVAAAIGHGTNQTQTAGSGYTKLGEAGGAWGDWAHEWRTDGTTTPSMSWASTDSSWGIAVEIKAATAEVGQQIGSTSTAFHPGRGPSRVARFWQTPRSTQMPPPIPIIGGVATPLHPGRGPSRGARFWQSARSTSIPAAAPGATGAATGEQHSADTAAGVKGAIGAAQSGTRTSGVSTGVKGAAGASTGQQRTADITAATKQTTGAAVGPQRSANQTVAKKGATGSQVGEQRSNGVAVKGTPPAAPAVGPQRVSGTTAGKKAISAATVGEQHTASLLAAVHKAAGATVGQVHSAAATAGVKAALGAVVGQQRSSGIHVSAAPVVAGHGVARVGTVTGTAVPDATTGTARVGATGGTAIPDATAGIARAGNTDGKVSIG